MFAVPFLLAGVSAGERALLPAGAVLGVKAGFSVLQRNRVTRCPQAAQSVVQWLQGYASTALRKYCYRLKKLMQGPPNL